MEIFREPVKKHCEDLLGRFQATESVRYERFLEVWRDMKFGDMFSPDMEPVERRPFTRLVMAVASPYFFPPYSFPIQVGALYLLYGLFNTQQITPREKIRIALKDWPGVMQLQKDAANAQHYDVVYIFRKLLSDKAFYFTAMPKPLCFREKREDGRQKDWTNFCEEFVESLSRPQELVTTDMVEEIANVHKHYEGMKNAVFTEPDPNLNLIHKNFVPNRISVITDYTDRQVTSETTQDDAGEGPSNQESRERAQLLASIKNKAYGQAVEAPKSRRHRQTEVVQTDILKDLSPRKKRKESLKARTLSYLSTHENRFDGVMGLTRIWCLSTPEGKEPGKKRKRVNWKLDKSSTSTTQ